MKNWKAYLFAFAALLAVAYGQSSGKLTVYDLEVKGTATGVGGATASSSLTDLKLTKTSPTVATIAAGVYAKGNSAAINYAGGTVTIGSLTISGCTNASPIVCTVSSMSGKSPRTGDSVTISGVGGNTAANGTFVIERLSDTTIALNGTTGNGSYTSGGTVAGAGSGTCVFYMTPQGYLTVDCPTSAALILSCTGNCTMNQSASPAPAGDGTYVGDMTVTTGAWDTTTVQRAFINAGWDVQAGTGISVANAGGTATVGVDSTVARTSGTNTFTGANSFTAATRTAPCRTGSGSPSALNGTAGDCYWQTDATAGANLWWATTTGTPATWTKQAGGGSSLVTYRLPFLTVQDPGGVSERLSFLWNSSTAVTVGSRDASAATCANTSSLAECGMVWYSLADAGQRYATTDIWMPTGWTSGTVTFFLTFATSSSVDPAFQVKTKCYTSGSAPASYNSTQNLPTGTVASGNVYTRSVSLTTTGCAANRPMTISLTRTDNTSGYAVVLDSFAEVQVQ